MPALLAGIHVFPVAEFSRTRMPGMKPGMTSTFSNILPAKLQGSRSCKACEAARLAKL
jgi:hypothetical protein